MLVDSQRLYTVEQWNHELRCWITIEAGLTLIDAEEVADEDTLNTRIIEEIYS